MLHGVHGLTLGIDHHVRGLVPDERLVRDWMATLREALKVLLADGAGEPPLLRKSAVPLALNLLASRVVVVARVTELLGVIVGHLARTKRPGDRQHGRPPPDLHRGLIRASRRASPRPRCGLARRGLWCSRPGR